jgi:hypothetical protein
MGVCNPKASIDIELLHQQVTGCHKTELLTGL